jgi:hypothetical protein
VSCRGKDLPVALAGGRRHIDLVSEGSAMSEGVAVMLVIMGFSIGGPMVGWIVYEIARNWQKVRVSEHLAALKQSMIERGMSADEIERVINAGAPHHEEAAKTASSG